MYKFAAVTMASLGLFLTGLLSGATLAVFSYENGYRDKTEKEKKDDGVDSAYEDLMKLFDQK